MDETQVGEFEFVLANKREKPVNFYRGLGYERYIDLTYTLILFSNEFCHLLFFFLLLFF